MSGIFMDHPLPDAAARKMIREDIDVNLVVEAAAGTGKTTCLVGRLMTLFRRGAVGGDRRLAAVTFTQKAAGELRERLERELGAAARDAALPPRERANLAAAAAVLPECHIGTIHSFCSRLIREYPVEAGVGPDFAEADDEADEALRRLAWDEFTAGMAAGNHPDLRKAFETFDLDLESLYPGFSTFSEFPDIDEWPGREFGADGIDCGAFLDSADRYLASLGPVRGMLATADAGTDEILPILRVLDARLARARQSRANRLRDSYRLAKLVRDNPKAVQKPWIALGLTREQAKEEHGAYADFAAGTAGPFRRDCMAAVYATALACFSLASRNHLRRRRERRLLNFQDLLSSAARLLRTHPHARAELAERYGRLLVDEVQDTDPVQAEIMFLLASANRHEPDWRQAALRNGAIFMVGDPKQSIYRFRRADIGIYQEMKRMVTDQGGHALGLSANFRSHPDVVDWVNRSFWWPESDSGKTDAELAVAGRFPTRESPYSPAYIPLAAGQARQAETCFSGVFHLKTISADKASGIADADATADEANRIARFIRHAVDTGVRIPDGKGGARAATAADFLLVTYSKKDAQVYAGAVRRFGFACQVSGGKSLAGSPALSMLSCYLKALADPADPVALLAVLRGGLFGTADTELYGWKKAGGGFSFTAGEGPDGRIGDIQATMREHARLFETMHPVAAASRIIDDLGLWALSALADDGATGVGAVATTLDLLWREGADISSSGKLAERLDWLLLHHEKDVTPARPVPADSVRVMNLHKTKGLEAPVVFLCGARHMKAHRATFAVERANGASVGALSITAGEHGNIRLAEPRDWAERAAREELYLAAETTRLRYVAATRAGAALVVSVHWHRKTGEWKSGFMPGGFMLETDIPRPLPEPDGMALDDHGVPEQVDLQLLATAETRREAARAMLLAESYATARPTPTAPERQPGGTEAPEEAMQFGEVLHRLLASSWQAEGGGEEARLFAEGLLRDFDLPTAMAGAALAMAAAAKESDLWRRAAASEKFYQETPFARTVERDGVPIGERGVIDLVFREADGWVVVDFKSDRLPDGADLQAAASRHRAQLHAYRDAWSGIVEETVKETGIFFLRRGVYVAVD